MAEVTLSPTRFNVSHWYPWDSWAIELTWPAGVLTGRTFTAHLGDTALTVGVVGDVMTITAPAFDPDDGPLETTPWVLDETAGRAALVGVWVPDETGVPSPTTAVTVVLGDPQVTVEVAVVGGTGGGGGGGQVNAVVAGSHVQVDASDPANPVVAVVGADFDPAGAATTAAAAAVAAIPSNGPAGTPSLRSLGATATTAAAGNDSRLSDARTPTAHAGSHAAAGGDPVTLSESQITGLVADLAAKAPLASPTFTGTPSAPTAAGSTNTTQLATTAMVQSAISTWIAANDVEVFKGSIDCSANPNYPLADAGHVYRVSVAGKIGGASGANVEVGDRLECVVDGSAAGNQATVGGNWIISQTNIDGAVVGPASSAVGNLPTFSGTTGKAIGDSGVPVVSLAPLASPTFTGDPKVPTQAATDNDTSAASTAFANRAVRGAGFTAAGAGADALSSLRLPQTTGLPAWGFGHSWMAADTWNTVGNRWWQQMRTRLGLGYFENRGVSGSTSIEIANVALSGWTLGNKGLVFVHCGGNEQVDADATVAAVAATLLAELKSTLAWLGAGTVVEATAMTAVGAWTNFGYAGATGSSYRYTTTSGDTLTATISGDKINVHYMTFDGVGFQGRNFEVRVDGTLKATVDNETLCPAATWGEAHGSIGHGVLEMTGLGAGSHSVEIKAIATLGGGAGTPAYVAVDCVAAPSATPPAVVLVVDPLVPTYATAPERAAILTQAQAAVSGRANVTIADVDPYWSASYFGSDGVHPLDVGEAAVATCVIDALISFLLSSTRPWGTGAASSVAEPYLARTLATAKGDLLAATASGTITRLAVGADGKVLRADSTQATGIGWQPRTLTVTTNAPGATPSVNVDLTDTLVLTGLAAAITGLTVTGTPYGGQKLIVTLTDNGTSRAIALGSSFENCGATIPSATTLGKTTTLGFIYRASSAKWGCVAAVTEA